HAGVAEHHGLHLLHGAGEVGADAFGGVYVVRVAPAARADGLHELIVPIGADAERRDGHAQAGGLLCLLKAALLLLGDAIGEEHHAVSLPALLAPTPSTRA